MIRSSIFELVISESFKFLIALEKVIITLVSKGRPVSPSAGSKVTVSLSSIVVNVEEVADIALSHSSSTVAPIATYTSWFNPRLLVGVIVIFSLAESITASNEISEPDELFCFRVIKLSTLASVTGLSSIFLIGSSNEIVISEFLSTFTAPLLGKNVNIGGSLSLAVKEIYVTEVELSD